MNIAFIGAGNVGAPLAARLAEAGHQVTLAETKEGSASVARALERRMKELEEGSVTRPKAIDDAET